MATKRRSYVTCKRYIGIDVKRGIRRWLRFVLVRNKYWIHFPGWMRHSWRERNKTPDLVGVGREETTELNILVNSQYLRDYAKPLYKDVLWIIWRRWYRGTMQCSTKKSYQCLYSSEWIHRDFLLLYRNETRYAEMRNRDNSCWGLSAIT